MKKIAAILIFSLFCVILTPYARSKPQFELWVLDVGQGESVLVREPTGKTLLFDGGPSDQVLSELGAVLPVWQKDIDLIILSHLHADHIRGLISVLGKYTVHAVWYSGAHSDSSDTAAFLEAIRNEGLTPTTVHAGHDAMLGEARLAVRYPVRDMVGQDPSMEHDADVVVQVGVGTETVLLTGDLAENHEREMLRSCKAPDCSLASDVLQIPHHGSASGLIPEFLQTVHPTLAVIPVGLDNKFRHPRQEILDKLEKAAVPVRRTDLDGRIHIVFSPESLEVSSPKASNLLLRRLPAPSVPP